MEFSHPAPFDGRTCETDHGPKPLTNVRNAAAQNRNFRTAFWTGRHLQMTLMSIPPNGDIGVEMHPDTDQFIRVEVGTALIRMGLQKDRLDSQHLLHAGDALFVPAGTWHNVVNRSHVPLKLSSIYARAFREA